MLLTTSAESEKRTLTITGTALVLCVVVVCVLIYAFNPFGGRPGDEISVAIDTPYAVQGVGKNTALLLHGVEVGKVTAISSLPNGAVRLDTNLRAAPAASLTDAMDIDFRPANDFGVTGINITPSAGGNALHDGMRVSKVPKGNFSLQALLTRVGELSTGVMTPQLIHVVDRVTRYTDALNPMIETLLIAGQAIADVQTVSTAQLVRNTAGLSVASPGLLDATSDAGDYASHADMNYMHKGLGDLTEQEATDFMIPTVESTSNGIFAAVGHLEVSHVPELLPLIDAIQPLTDVITPLARPVGVGDMLVELRSRFERLYGATGTPEQQALQVRIVLDSLPGVAAPLGIPSGDG
jgi:hypothetical protein